MGLYGIKDSANLTFYSRKTGKPALYMDYANKFEISITADSVSATKKGTKAITWDLPKEGTITIETQMTSNELFAFVLKSQLETAVLSQFRNREVFTVTEDDQAVILKEEAKDNLAFVQILDEDFVTSAGMLETATVATATGETTVTLTGATVGQRVAIYYITEKEAESVFTIKDGTGLAEDYLLDAVTTTKEYVGGDETPVAVTVYKCTPQTNATFTFDATTPSTFTITLNMMIDENGKMLDIKPLA